MGALQSWRPRISWKIKWDDVYKTRNWCRESTTYTLAIDINHNDTKSLDWQSSNL